MIKLKKAPSILIVFFLAASWTHVPGFCAQEVKISQKDGVTVVHNPDQPVSLPGTPSRVRLIHELTIGEETGDENSMIFDLRTLQVDDQGNMYVLDDKIDQVRVFDKNGKHLRTWGKKGQGPGEFQNLSRMALTPEGLLSFLDLGNHRFSLYSLEGECLKEIPFNKWRPNRFFLDSQGFGYGDILEFSDGVSNILLKFDGKLVRLSTVAELKLEGNPSERTFPLLFFRLTFRVFQDDSIVWASTGNYELNFVDSQGKTVKRIIRDFKKRPVAAKDKDIIVKQYFGAKGAPSNTQLYFSEYHPILYYFLQDDEGKIYVRTYEQDERGFFIYDVFDTEGRYFARFSLPEEELIAAVKNGKVYCSILENAEGIPQVKRYAMTWER